MKLRILSTALLVCGVLAGCQGSNERIAFDGQYFRTKVRKVDGQRDVFTVTIRDVSRSLSGARAAGRYEGTSYCVGTYGSSKIDWAVGPETPPERLRIRDDTLVFQGICAQ